VSTKHQKSEDMADNSHSCNTRQWTYSLRAPPVDIVGGVQRKVCLFLHSPRGYQAQPGHRALSQPADEFGRQDLRHGSAPGDADQVLAYSDHASLRSEYHAPRPDARRIGRSMLCNCPHAARQKPIWSCAGDTTSTLSGAGGIYDGIPVGHVEAGCAPGYARAISER